MHIEVILRGVLIGLTASVPLGPIGILCVQRTISKKFKSGFVSGLGAASADTIFALGAMFFLSLIMSFVDMHLNLLKAIGGIIIVVLGIRIFSKNIVVQIRRNRANRNSLWKDYLSVFFLTLTNPTYLLVFVALFAAFGINEQLSFSMRLLLIAGVSLGACLWWFTLAFSLHLIREKFRPRHLFWINRITGTIIVILGIAAILSIFINVPVSNVENILHIP